MSVEAVSPARSLPLDGKRLDRGMEEAGIDLVLATSKHNVQYLLGGYRSHFFAQMDATGLSRYLPIVGYPRGKPGGAFYVGSPQEKGQQAVEPLWVPVRTTTAGTSERAATEAAQAIRDLGCAAGTIAVEMPFLPVDAYLTLGRLLPEARIVDAVSLLEDLRAVKQPWELQLVKEASESVVEAMGVVIRRAVPGMTTQQLADLLLQEEVARGLAFDYALIATGTNMNRTPSAVRWEQGGTLSLDSGGNKRGYIGDLARMAILGSPTREQEELLAEIDAVQMAARVPIKAGAVGQEIYDHALAEQARCAHGPRMDFVAHGMGLVSHEAPRLARTGMSYPPSHADRPLEAGMVISIETTIASTQHGYIKLEDTVAVTASGWEAYGDTARGWNTMS